MNVKCILPLLAITLFAGSCANSPSTTLEERAPLAASVFYWELDQAEEELQTLRAQFSEAGYSTDAVKILDSLATSIQNDIDDARYDMARFDAKPDVSILHIVGNNTLALYDDIMNLRAASYRKR